MDQLLLHPQTQIDLHSVLGDTSHALLLTGDIGAGKLTVAKYVAKTLLGVPALANAPYYLHVSSPLKAISIEQVRGVQSFLQLKTTGTANIRRVVLIEDADSMTDEAQNALLKSLEEPPADTVLILTASQPQQLKETIHSRSQKTNIRPVNLSDATAFFVDYKPVEVARAHSISAGNIGLMTAMLESQTDHVLAQSIELAKEIYSLSSFERLARVDQLTSNKGSLKDFLYACKRICQSALEQAALKRQDKAVASWHRQLKLVHTAEQRLRVNTNPKLLLTDFFIQM